MTQSSNASGLGGPFPASSGLSLCSQRDRGRVHIDFELDFSEYVQKQTQESISFMRGVQRASVGRQGVGHQGETALGGTFVWISAGPE